MEETRDALRQFQSQEGSLQWSKLDKRNEGCSDDILKLQNLLWVELDFDADATPTTCVVTRMALGVKNTSSLPICVLSTQIARTSLGSRTGHCALIIKHMDHEATSV